MCSTKIKGMKKGIVFAGISFLASTMMAQNQERYLRVGVGHAVCIGPAAMRVESKVQTSDVLRTDYRAVPASYGTGWTVSAATTKMLSLNFGFDLKADIQSGRRVEYWTLPSIVAFLRPMDNNMYYSEGFAATRSGSIMFSPCVFLKFNSRQLMKPYIRAGLVGGIAWVDSWSNELNRPDYFQSTGTANITTREHDYGYLLGITTGAGLEYRCFRNVDLFAELDFYRSCYLPSGRRLSELEISGQGLGAEKTKRFDQPMVAQYLSDHGAATVSLQIGMRFRLGH